MASGYTPEKFISHILRPSAFRPPNEFMQAQSAASQTQSNRFRLFPINFAEESDHSVQAHSSAGVRVCVFVWCRHPKAIHYDLTWICYVRFWVRHLSARAWVHFGGLRRWQSTRFRSAFVGHAYCVFGSTFTYHTYYIILSVSVFVI